jgi:hypothetical protein
LTDKANSRLEHELAEKKFTNVTPDLRANILQFFSGSNPPAGLKKKKDKDDWERTVAELDELKAYVPQDQTSPGSSSVGDTLLEVVPTGAEPRN